MYLSVLAPEKMLKKVCIELEATEPIGRVWDIDLLDMSGIPLSRQQFGYPVRRCLICSSHAHRVVHVPKNTLLMNYYLQLIG